MTIEVLISVGKSKNCISPHPSTFLIISNKMRNIELGPYISYIFMEIVVCLKGWVIKDIKAPRIVKVELTDL